MQYHIPKRIELQSYYKENIKKYFPEAVRSDLVTKNVNGILTSQSFSKDNTLFGTSHCPDEINEFVINLKTTWGNKFPLTGLGGASLLQD